MNFKQVQDLQQELRESGEREDLLWEKIEAITRLVDKACLKMKESSSPKDHQAADQITEDLMRIRGQVSDDKERPDGT